MLAAYLASRDRGEAPDAETWVARFPEHAEALRSYLASEAWVAAAVSAFRGEVHEEEPAATSLVIPGYTIVREIARGGMGVVFEAEQHHPRRRVALKTLRDSALATRDELQRFRREAQAAADLDHPGIVRIYELGETEGRVWFTMPLAEGGSVAGRMHRYLGDIPRSVRLIRDVARAVAHGHARGVLHRDLKPSNILLDGQGHPIVADFGLARRTATDTGAHTLTGTVLGTPAYMAPEQARGDVRAIEERTDIWSLGVILHELVVGTVPFQASTPADLPAEVARSGEAPSLRRRGLPRRLVSILQACLRRDPTRRYASMRDLADDLDRFLHGTPIRARSPGLAERGWGFLSAHRGQVLSRSQFSLRSPPWPHCGASWPRSPPAPGAVGRSFCAARPGCVPTPAMRSARRCGSPRPTPNRRRCRRAAASSPT
jgi:serine/threonine-protein kinase